MGILHSSWPAYDFTRFSFRMWVAALVLTFSGIMSTFLDACSVWRTAMLFRLSQGLEVAACLAAILVGGTCMYAELEGLMAVDSLYLSLATATTVGYGDLKPVTDMGKIATMVYAALSLSVFGYITSCVGDLIQPDSDTSIGFGGKEDEWVSDNPVLFR